jgi:assimilatory nitrate reductase catalytic subunit
MSTPRFLQGVFPFVGRGIYESEAVEHDLEYVVPDGHRARVLYVRLGNHALGLIYLTLTANGSPIRYFPVGPQGALHIPLAIQEAHPAGTKLTFSLAAERGVSGTLILDVGIEEEKEARVTS